jgi:hypothetical protein
MKLLICGDSWSKGYGVNLHESWPNFLNCEFVNVAKNGSTNRQIVEQFLTNYNNTFDAAIIGWSGATRFRKNDRLNEFSSVDQSTIKYFSNKSLNDILKCWDHCINTVSKTSTVPVIHYSVFGDIPLSTHKNFLEESFLEYLANASNIFFKYSIPIFEFDWLNNKNYKLTKVFGEKYFNKNWERACVEREQIRPSKYFLICGHPNKDGHKVWASYIKEVLNDIVSK